MANEPISKRPQTETIANDDLFLISQKQPNGSYISKNAPGSLIGKSAYTVWVEYNTTEIQYLTTNTAEYIYQTSNITNVQTFITQTNLTENYNTWVLNKTYNNYENLYSYIYSNPTYIQQFEEYNIINNNETIVNNMINFIEEINQKTEYVTYVDNKNINVTEQTFLTEIHGDTVYNSYITTHPGVSTEQFLTNLGLQNDFNEWVIKQLQLLDNNKFIEELKGSNGVGSVANKYEDLYINASGVYIPADPPVSGISAVRFGILAAPQRLYIKMDQNHQMYVEDETTVVKVLGNFVKLVGTSAIPFENFEMRLSNGKIVYNPTLNPEDTLLINANEVIKLEYSQSDMTKENTVSITLVAQKIRSFTSSVNGLKIQGLWKIHDSILGYYKEWNETEPSFIDNFEVAFNKDFNSNNPFGTSYAVSSQYSDQGTVLSINNMSNVRRILTLIPYPGDANPFTKGELLSDPNRLPANVVQKQDGSIEMTLTAWED